MEEEKKEVVQAEEQPQQGGMTPNCKNGLIAFILAVVGFGFGFGWFVGAVAGIVLGIVALVFLKKLEGEVEKQPFRTFVKIAKPLAIVDIILGAVMIVVWVLVLVIPLIVAGLAAAADAAASLSFLL